MKKGVHDHFTSKLNEEKVGRKHGTNKLKQIIMELFKATALIDAFKVK